MERPPMHDLRFNQEKKGVANRKDALEFDTFMMEWQKLLKRKGLAWQGGQAIAELEQKGVLSFFRPVEGQEIGWQIHDIFDEMLREMKAYRDEARKRLTKEYYSDAKSFLQSELGRIQKQKERNRIADVRALLESVEKKLMRSIETLDWLTERRRNWRFGAWQHLWHDVPRNNMVEGKSGLDTRLQVQLGKILGDYLLPEKVTQETIARLVVLAYCAGELAEWDGKALHATYTHRLLKVRNVRDILAKRNLVKSYSSRKASFRS